MNLWEYNQNVSFVLMLTACFGHFIDFHTFYFIASYNIWTELNSRESKEQLSKLETKLKFISFILCNWGTIATFVGEFYPECEHK